MNNFLKEEKFSFHLIFLFVLSLYYLIPYFFTGQLILKPSDILDGEIVYNHIIGKFYRGEPESIDLFIGGEIKKKYFNISKKRLKKTSSQLSLFK